MSSTLRIGLAGLGTVGGGTLAILREHAVMIEARAGQRIEVVAVTMRDPKKPRAMDLSGIKILPEAEAMAEEDLDIVVELMGGHDGAALRLVTRALEKGKHVVSANKALIAHHGLRLAALAEKHDRVLAFEAAVAGGIPIIAALRNGLAANRITRVAGILNGTCNYILTKMLDAEADFDAVLAEAGTLGYLEADPALDIDGIDAAHKVSILASLAFGTVPNFAGVERQGIRQITLRDMYYARDFGYRIKLLGIVEKHGPALLQRVEPCLVPVTAPLASVSGGFNAVEVEGDAVGRVVFEGRGAGAGPTGSAVVADIMAIARGDRYPPFTLPTAQLASAAAMDASYRLGSYYIRLSLRDEPGVLAEFTREFAAQHISVKSIVQREIAGDKSAQVVVTTHQTNEAAVRSAVAAIQNLRCTVAPPVLLRIHE
ncbi:MAG: homoserine dehydrogenase [Alphaproteobacteria bacterium]